MNERDLGGDLTEDEPCEQSLPINRRGMWIHMGKSRFLYKMHM